MVPARRTVAVKPSAPMSNQPLTAAPKAAPPVLMA